jgi:hypothetical protein
MEKTFAELFCSHRGLSPQQYHRVMMRSCVYRRTLLLWPFLALLVPGYFKADHELITRIGLLTKPASLDDEIDVFWHDISNHTFVRRVLCLRVSTQRVRNLFNLLMPQPPSMAQNDAGPDVDERSSPPWRRGWR